MVNSTYAEWFFGDRAEIRRMLIYRYLSPNYNTVKGDNG